MTGARSQRKGANGEREVVAIYRQSGFEARRNFGSGSQGGSDITGHLLDVPEVKRVARVVKYHEWVAQATEGAVGTGLPWSLWIRVDGGQWTVTTPAAHYMALLEDRVTLRTRVNAEGLS